MIKNNPFIRYLAIDTLSSGGWIGHLGIFKFYRDMVNCSEGVMAIKGGGMQRAC